MQQRTQGGALKGTFFTGGPAAVWVRRACQAGVYGARLMNYKDAGGHDWQ